jgi:uncharacterized protein YukE
MDWSPLGGNPVPGDPGEVRRLAGRFDDIADDVAVQVSRLRRLSEHAGSGMWTGPAADACRSQLDNLPPLLAKVVVSYRRAGRALSGYAPRLAGAQDKAVHALRLATEALSEQASAQAAARRTLADHGRSVPAAGIVATPYVLARVDPAVQAADDKLARAHDLAAEAAGDCDRAASACAAELHEASAAGIHNSGGFFHWVEAHVPGIAVVADGWRAVDHLIDAHVGVIKKISDIAGDISGWIGYAALATLPIPGVGEVIGAVATVAGTVQLLADSTLALAGDGSWAQVGVDAGGVAASGAGSVFRDGAGALRAGLDAERGAGAAAPVTTVRAALARGWRRNVNLRDPAFLSDPVKAAAHPVRFGEDSGKALRAWYRRGDGLKKLPRTLGTDYVRYLLGGHNLKVGLTRGAGNLIDGGYQIGSPHIPTGSGPDRAGTPSERPSRRREAQVPDALPGECAA